MIEQVFTISVTILFILVFFLFASVFIPYYGFIWKRWKGLAIGCLVQPIICVLISVMAIFCIAIHHRLTIHRHKEAAMVTVKKTDANGFSHHWYVKSNEECFYEYSNDNEEKHGRRAKKEKEGENDSDDDNVSREEITLFYDVIPIDSFSVCIDDKVVIKFDLKEHKVAATEYDEPIEVVNVNWEKVSDYFENQAPQGEASTNK